jgi:hypothetical protein
LESDDDETPSTTFLCLARAEGAFVMYLRLYWPMEEALDGKWKSPPLKRAEKSGGS